MNSMYSEGYAHCALGALEVGAAELDMVSSYTVAEIALAQAINGHIPQWNDAVSQDEQTVWETMMATAKNLRNSVHE